MRLRFCFILVPLLAGLPWDGRAQAPGPGYSPPVDRPGQARPEPPRLDAAPRRPEFALPDATSLLPRDGRLSAGLLITVRRFEIVGATVFSREALEARAAPFLDRPIGNEELEELRLRLTRLYVDAGYINSGALIPDQELREGVLTLQIVEGTLSRVEVGGEHRFDPAHISSRLLAGAGSPLHVPALQERMQLMLQDSQIERMNAELAPGARPGESVLRVAVTEAPRHSLGLSVANNRSPSVGSNRIELLGAARNLLGMADSWTLRLGKTRGLDDYALSAALPVSVRDTQLNLRYEKNTSLVIEEPFRALNIDSLSETFEIGLRHPWLRSLQRSLILGAALSLREATTRLAGERFSFSPGVQNGGSRVAALRLSGEWLDRGQDHVFSARGVLSFGLDAFGATRNGGSLPDSRFVAGLAQAQWVRRLDAAGAQLILRGDLQSADSPLLPLEKFAIGGADSVRGFRENRIVRDRGWAGSAEVRVPVGHLPLPALSPQGDGRLALALFVDAGQAWDKDGAKESLWGAGPGLRWDLADDAYAQLYWAGKRKRIAGTTNDLQDKGIHLKFVLQRHF